MSTSDRSGPAPGRGKQRPNERPTVLGISERLVLLPPPIADRADRGGFQATLAAQVLAVGRHEFHLAAAPGVDDAIGERNLTNCVQEPVGRAWFGRAAMEPGDL